MFSDELDDILTEYTVVYPSVTNSEGDFLSHDLRNGHNIKRRKRRDISSDIVGEQIINVGTGTAEIFGRQPDAIDLNGDMYIDRNRDDDENFYNFNNQQNHTFSNFALRNNYTDSLGHHGRPHHRRRHTNEIDDHIYYNISAFGTHYHLKLQQKRRLIAPGAKAVWFGDQNTDIDSEESLNSDCVYAGLIRHQHDSRVAITSCSGLVR